MDAAFTWRVDAAFLCLPGFHPFAKVPPAWSSRLPEYPRNRPGEHN